MVHSVPLNSPSLFFQYSPPQLCPLSALVFLIGSTPSSPFPLYLSPPTINFWFLLNLCLVLRIHCTLLPSLFRLCFIEYISLPQMKGQSSFIVVGKRHWWKKGWISSVALLHWEVIALLGALRALVIWKTKVLNESVSKNSELAQNLYPSMYLYININFEPVQSFFLLSYSLIYFLYH